MDGPGKSTVAAEAAATAFSVACPSPVVGAKGMIGPATPALIPEAFLVSGRAPSVRSLPAMLPASTKLPAPSSSSSSSSASSS